MLRHAFALLALVTLVSGARGQDDPDVMISQTFKKSPDHRSRLLDMAFLQDGRLVAAYVEEVSPGPDRVVVMTRDPLTLAWTLLLNSGGYTMKVLELALAVPAKLTGDPARDQAYVALHLAEDVGLGVDQEWMALLSGPLDKPWAANMGRMAFLGSLPQPAHAGLLFEPSIAVVPSAPGDFSSYSVEMVFKLPDDPSASGGSIWRATSRDYGRTVKSLVMLAGSGASGIAGMPASGSINFSHPSAASDDKNAALVVAFADDADGCVHVAAGPSKLAKLPFLHTTPGSVHKNSAPMATAHDGLVYMTTLTDQQGPGGGVRLVWHRGTSYDSSSWQELGTLHASAASPGDIEIREGAAWVAARCTTDNVPGAAPVHAIVAPTNLLSAPQAVPVSAGITNASQPRVAVAAESFSPGFTVFGWSQLDWSMPWTPAGGEIFIDP